MKSAKRTMVLGLVLGFIFMIVGQAAAYSSYRVDFRESADDQVDVYYNDLFQFTATGETATFHVPEDVLFTPAQYYTLMREPTGGDISDVLLVNLLENGGADITFQSDPVSWTPTTLQGAGYDYFMDIVEDGTLQLLFFTGTSYYGFEVYGQSDVDVPDVEVPQVPEPATILLLGLGLVGLTGVRRKFKR